MNMNQENNKEAKMSEMDLFSILGLIALVLLSASGWYFLGKECFKEFVAGEEVRSSLFTPFLLLLSFYIFRDFFRMLKNFK